MQRWIWTALCAMPAASYAQSPPPAPYAGQQAREIKALSAEEVAGYLAGEGHGLAKAAELNHYPGPRHVLDMAARLRLSEAQQTEIRKIYDRMHARAAELGAAIVEAEHDLDQLFRAGTIDAAALHVRVSGIARLQGELRESHLAAHVATRPLLSEAQRRLYEELRGYAVGHREHHPSP